MVRKNRIPLSTTIAPSTFEAIEKLSTELSTTNSVALDIIVREWLGSTKIEPVKCTNVLPKLDHLGESHKILNIRLQVIENLLFEMVYPDDD